MGAIKEVRVPNIGDFKEVEIIELMVKPGDRILDVGCGKGFLLYEFTQVVPGVKVAGLDISAYAIENAKEEVRPYLRLGNAADLPYPDRSFQFVFSITTLHNLYNFELRRALQEIERVSKGNSFVTVDAYRNEAERERMFAWNLTGKTILHVDEWKAFFDEVGYTGDYYWFIP